MNVARQVAAREPLLIAVGDLHGHARAFERIVAALDERHGLLGPRGALRSGVTLVTTGDHVDRGEHALEILARLRALSRGAGRVVSLLGNHEILALESLDRAAAIARDSGAEDPISEYELSTVHGLNGGGAFVREFGANPRGALSAYVRRMSPRGDVGRWLRRLRPCFLARFAGKRILFTHGDLADTLRDADRLDGYLGRLRRHLSDSSDDVGGTSAKWGHADLSGSRSIFWNRSFHGLAAGPGHEPGEICSAVGVDYLVTGHTPHPRITTYGGRIFRVDVGVTPAYGENQPEALVFSARGAHALSADGSERPLVAYDAALTSAA